MHIGFVHGIRWINVLLIEKILILSHWKQYKNTLFSEKLAVVAIYLMKLFSEFQYTYILFYFFILQYLCPPRQVPAGPNDGGGWYLKINNVLNSN